MQIYIASDHAGFELKNALVPFLKGLGHEVEDCGTSIYKEDDDYPDFIMPCAQKVAQNKASFGIVIGGSGQGEAIAANRIKGVRAAVYYGGDVSIVPTARKHNDANVLSFGARFVNEESAKMALELFLTTPFSNEERHIRRITKLDIQ